MDGKCFDETAARIVKMLKPRRRMTAVELEEYFDNIDKEVAKKKKKAFEKMKADPNTYKTPL